MGGMCEEAFKNDTSSVEGETKQMVTEMYAEIRKRANCVAKANDLRSVRQVHRLIDLAPSASIRAVIAAAASSAMRIAPGRTQQQSPVLPSCATVGRYGCWSVVPRWSTPARSRSTSRFTRRCSASTICTRDRRR